MSLLPASASFEERVQDCFLAYRGAGVMLSTLDAELVEVWATQEIPFEVVARGLRKAAEAALWDAPSGEGGLRSLRSCKQAVEQEIQKYLRRAAGRAEGKKRDEKPAHLQRHAKLRAALKKLAKEHPQLQRGVEALLSRRLAAAPDDLSQAAGQEEAVYLALSRALPFAERIQLLRESRQLAQNCVAISPPARKMARRLHRAAVLRRRLSLPSFW